MCEPHTAPNANLAAQALYAKLQKLSEDIQLQHSIITAQKETVLKSRQRTYDVQKTELPAGGDQAHLVHAHAGTVLQHRAMIIKHYELIQQHKQMVKEQGLHVQNLTSALLNIQQETNVVDELMNTKMAENRNSAIIQSTKNNDKIGPSIRTIKSKRRKSKGNSNLNTDSATNSDNNTISSDTSIVSHTENVKQDDSEIENNQEQITSITTTTSTTTTTTTPTSTTTETTTISSTTTPTSTTSTLTTSTTTTTKPPLCTSPPPLSDSPLPLSP